MGDSDDEYNQVQSSTNNTNSNQLNSSSSNTNQINNYNNKNKNRDKFYRERDDSSTNNNNSSSVNTNYNTNRRDWSGGDRGRANNTSDAWKNRSMSSNMNNPQHMSTSNYSGGNYQQRMGSSDYPRKYSGHNQTSPANFDSNSPPYKRNKKDWDSNDSNRNLHGSGLDSYSSQYHHGSNYNTQKSQHSDSFSKSDPDYPTQPPFLSFKLFLQQQDDNISDEDAIKKYNDYKTEFKKTQINNFFLEHKEEDWFKLRYHPDENYKRRNEQNQCVLNRLQVFMDLVNSPSNWLENASVEMDHSKDLIKFLDAVVIKLEGGTDQDLKSLDGTSATVTTTSEQEVKEIQKEENDSVKTEPKLNDNDEESKTNGTHGSNGNGETSESDTKKRKSEDSGSESGAYTDSDDNSDENKTEPKKKKQKKQQTTTTAVKSDLHRTSSIFMRNLAPSVTKQDLENLCKNYEGFKRIALSDPGPERGFFRRGWITFESHVDVKKICWSLQNTKIRDFNPGAIVNRELTNRIRPIPNLVSHHKSVIKNDIKLAMKIVQSMDKRWNLWQDKDLNESVDMEPVEEVKPEPEDAAEKETANLEREAFCKLEKQGPKYLPHKFIGTNPLLNNITDYLVDETNAEEEELLGDQTNQAKSDNQSLEIELDRQYNKVLDKLVLYLRVVHSIDFYNSTEYQQEDSMPNRCGIMFVRPAMPVNAASASLKITQDEINQYIQQFETKMKPFIDYKEKLDVDQAKKLGIKERVEEVEKFIKTNTQELAADRWLCPLSGKKFKGPEFIRKHLFYKHMDKIIEVKKEVEYFNNYVYDPKRPQLPEHPSNKAGATSHQSSGQQHQQSSYSSNVSQNSPALLAAPMMSGGQNMNYSMQNRNMNWQQQQQQGYMSNNMMQNYGGFGYGGGMQQMGNQFHGGFKKPGFDNQLNRRPMGRDSREMIQYKDLDAPDDN